jgi:hypothetical protein
MWADAQNVKQKDEAEPAHKVDCATFFRTASAQSFGKNSTAIENLRLLVRGLQAGQAIQCYLMFRIVHNHDPLISQRTPEKGAHVY